METENRGHPGVFFPPPLIYVLFYLLALVLQRLVPLPAWSTAPVRPLVIVLAVLGLALAVWSMRRFSAAHTSPIPIRPATALVIDGPYRFTRNPMYLSLALLYTAMVGWTGLTWALVLLPLLVPTVDWFVIRPEERHLTAQFGAPYDAYRHRVRRWL